MKVIKPLGEIVDDGYSIFLAGTVETSEEGDWRQLVVDALSGTRAIIYNPYRADWDETWDESIDDPQFREQVEWELEALERADLIALYLSPGTHSPISLLELGLHSRSGKVFVCCPEGFLHKGNVDIVCRRYGILLWETFEPFLRAIIATALELDELDELDEA